MRQMESVANILINNDLLIVHYFFNRLFCGIKGYQIFFIFANFN